MTAMVDFKMPETYRNNKGQTRRVRDMVDHVARQTGQTTGELMEDVMRLWAIDLTRETYPKRRAQGVKNVTADALKLFAPIEQFDNPALRRRFNRGGDFDITESSLLFRPRLKSDAIAGEVSAARNHRGRVPGRWSSDRVRKVVRQRELNRFIRGQKRRIGRLKAGWAAVAAKFGVKLPGWVSQHGASESGYTDALNRQTLDGYLEAESRVPYASDRLGGRFMDFLLSKRVTDLQQGTYAKRWQKKMERMTA